MGAFRSSIPRLLWLFLVAGCLLFLLPNTGYQVFANENDADLVFENNLEESKISEGNKHTIERRDASHRTAPLNSKSSQPVEDEHWLTTAVKRFKRQWNIFGNLFTDDEKKEDSRERRASGEEGQQTGQLTDNDFDNDIDDDDDDDVPEEQLIPQSQKQDLFGGFRGDDDDEDGFDDLSSGEGSATEPSLQIPIVPGQPIYYRISMTLLEPFIEQFRDHNSREFKEVASNLVKAMDDLYEDLNGQQSATVIKIEKREADVFTSKVTMDLGTVDYYDHGRIQNHLLSHIRRYHMLGSYQVSDEDFGFRQFDGRSALPSCGPNELPCHSGECVLASARCDGNIDCRDHSDEAGCADYHINEVDSRPSYEDRYDRPSVETTPRGGLFSTIMDTILNQTSGLDNFPDEVHPTEGRPWYIPATTETSHRPALPFNPPTERYPPYDDRDREPPTTSRGGLFSTMFDTILNQTTGLDNFPDEPRPTEGRPWFVPQPAPTTETSYRPSLPFGTYAPDRGDKEQPVESTTRSGFLSTVFGSIFNTSEEERPTETPWYIPTVTYRPAPYPTPQSRCRADDVIRCRDGSPICADQKCDERQDCPDGDDEWDCGACAEGELSCDISRCVPLSKRCDGQFDCDDRTDELECEPVCRSGQFRCASGQCIEDYQRCDRRPDCRDGDDEQNCPSACRTDEFQCVADKRCIANTFRCDSVEDCNDGSDEVGCDKATTCGAGQFDCEDGRCISESQKCDGRSDCSNGLDEYDCALPPPKVCGAHEHTCNDGSCIPSYFVCDGTPNCRDGSDESECGCQSNEFQCSNGACVPDYLRCDRRPDCSDGSDEINCGTERPPPQPEPTRTPLVPGSISCPRGQQPCRSGNQCFPYAAFCDGRFDCNDFSDETNCGGSREGLNLKTYPSQQTIKESVYKPGREVVFQCRDEGPSRARVQWLRGNGLPLPPGSRDNNGRLEIPNIQIEHSGAYTCAAIGYPPNVPGSQVHVYLTVEPYTPPPSRPLTACDLHEATCANGDCIAKHLVCNGHYDCSDGSDETRCSAHCEPNEFRCNNKKCVYKTWLCDGQDDCLDGSDELNCAPTAPGAPCPSTHFACHSGNQCVPKSLHCDQQNDCVDGSDEVGCSNVVIFQPPPPMVQLHVGETFTITCKAVGVPTPEIVWRLNWGHIPDKCKITSVNGVGTLTCPDIQAEDQGAYSCEAINIRGPVFAIPDTILVVIGVGPPLDVCPRGTFNEEARETNECLNCFCFGVATECRSADLFTYQLQPPFVSYKYVGVKVDPYTGVVNVRDEPVYRGDAQPRLTGIGANGVHAQLASPYGDFIQPDVIPYFALPENFLHNQLKSYGGYIKYKLQYEGFGRPISAPNIIVTGNGYTLLHVGRQHQSGGEENVSVRLFAGEWVKRSETSPETVATREEIMMALENVENILIKLQYVDGHLDTKLSSIEMDSAAIRNTGQGQAVFVEECKCPVGYKGLSCESCADGYTRHRSGPWLGQCYREPEVCPPGTYGDPARGISCQTCPCPLTNPSNQFARTCHLDPDGEVTCDCPPGYIGRRCQQCAAGYTGNPLIPGDLCRPGGICSTEGASSSQPDPSGRCICKQNTDGPTCNQCKPNTFHLSAENQFGCIACFCMGITQQCTSSNWYRDTISSAFTNSRQDFTLVESLRKEAPIVDGIRLDQYTREIVYSDFSNRNQDVYYWSLPSRYLGDKLTSYGGHLRYSLRYDPMPGGQSSRNTAPDVELISENQLNLLYFGQNYPQPNSNQSFSVPFFEQHWQRADGQKADREHLLMALADLKAILIKATYTTNTREAALLSVSLDIASERNTGRERALAVEQCHCPAGYRGLSCEDCDIGFTRATEGIYLGLCEACACNGHSNECDPETGECYNCRDHTTGPNCESCEPGYSGNPAAGIPCTGGGRPQVCECNVNGSVSSLCVGGVCQCKTNVEGRLCDRCRPGTFGLSGSNPEGCQECFCSGVTDQCYESNLYREQIPSQILYQHNHGFSVTDYEQRNRITTDFILNVAENKIGYSFRPGSNERWYWSLPSVFTGNKIKSYGGKLEFTQHYSTDQYRAPYTPDQDIVISGHGIKIYWTNPGQQSPERDNKISVLLHTNSHWQRIDPRQPPRPASRDDIMIVLANIDSILVRATLSQDTTASYISDITLDTAVEQYTRQPQAKDVEECRCPPGYRGTSCESCSAGYYRDINDLQTGPLGSCTKCPCSGNEESCNLGPDNRVVCHCLPGYTGPSCQYQEGPPTPPPQPPPTQAPTITITMHVPKIQIVPVGTSVQMRCSATSPTPNLPIRLSWNKDGGYLPPDHAIDDGRGLLVITGVRVSDAGNYICQATDGYVIVTDYTTLIVGENPAQPPVVTISPPSLELKQGFPIEIYCSASGTPTPTLQWIRPDGQRLSTQHSFVNGVFRIPSANVSDQGEYECIASSRGGIGRGSIYVRVDEVGVIMVVTLTPREYYGKTGDSFTLTCDAPRPWSSIRWSRLHEQALPYTAVISDDERTITVYNAKPEDSGTYICTVTSYAGPPGSATGHVTITREPQQPEEFPKVVIDPERQVVAQGSMIEIRCEATGSPPPTIKWTKVGDPLGQNSQQIGNILRIQNVQNRDTGTYVCIASNSAGFAQGSSYLEIERREAPVIEIHPRKDLTVTTGHSLIVHCRVISGFPQPTIHWSRPNGQPLSNSIEQLSNGVLRFTSININEAGEYMCTAENIAGKTTAIGHIEVHTAPVLTIIPRSGTITVREGEYIRLECRASGVPQPTVQWSRHTASYPSRADVSGERGDALTGAMQNVAVYEITRVSSADQGYYICQGRNSAGAAEERVSLLVDSPDSIPQRGDITGEDGSAGQIDNEVTPYPPYIPPRYPPYRDNERTPTYTDKTFTAPVGTRAELRCQTRSPAGSDPIYVNWVRGDNSSLPDNSLISNGILYIDDVQPRDAGEYRCLGVHPSGAILFSFSAHLVVVSPPRITLHPPRQVVRPGDNAYVECAATGEQPITITWSPISREMPQSAYARDGHLQFRGIQVSDAGRYRCTAVNPAGEADAVADVVVQDYHQGPTITAENKQQTAVIGTSLTLHCIVRGGEQPAPSVRWFREHLPLPTNSRVSGEYIQIIDVQPTDAGRYFCEVASEGGTASDYIDVRVEQPGSRESDSGSPDLDIQASIPTAHAGETVDLYCRSNEPGVITSWSKLSGRFANNVQASGATLRISSARRENAGVYRCEARGYHGVYHKDYDFEVIGSSIDNVQDEQPVETKTAPQGSTIVMECRTDLEQPISYQWSKPGGVLPREVDIHARSIQINEVRESDAGTYICTASNDRTSIDIPTILIVTGIVPYFNQAPISFISLPTFPDGYVQFNFEISFKPETQDGLLLYNGHRRATPNSDFISLALVNGYPEFRINLGQGVTIIRGDRPVALGQWHTIKVSRNRKKATMYVDGDGPFTGTANTKYVGLDLTEPLYLGGVPNYRDIAPEVEVDTGFVGCISRFKIGHAHQDILREATIKEGITTCETCSENPCQNHGVCQEALNAEGYTCICPSGYSGVTCSRRGGETCTPYVCGPGRCVDEQDGLKCLCPMGRAGRRCEREITVYEPGFVNDAYIAYPTPKPHRRLKVSLKFKPKDLNDGILLYCGESEDGHGDFASLAIRDRHVEFRFDVGNEPVVIRSERELRPGEWLAVTASKILNEGRLLVNGDVPVTKRISGNHKALSLHTPLYVGGVDKQRVNVNQGVGVYRGFNGCISEINMSGLDLNIIQSVTDSANVEDCSTLDSTDSNESSNEISSRYGYDHTLRPYDSSQTGCSSGPCQNDGQCYPLSPVDYNCNCIRGHTGRNCEIPPNVCDYQRPCQNGGTCNGTATSYTCDCPIGYAGRHCEQRADIRNEVNFNGNAYIELSNSLLSHQYDDENEVIAFELSTNSSNGLLFWHGQRPDQEGQGQDYISLAVVDGFLEYSFELGSGPAIIYNNEVRINDGERHRVILKRRGRWGSIEVDNDHIVEGYADGFTSQMNCDGNIYLGGTPNNSLMTGGRYQQGFSGCIYGFELQDSRMLDLGAKAIYGVNVKPCSSPNDIFSVFERPEDDLIF